MEFKKPSKEDMPVVIITTVFVVICMISSATSPTETGETLTFGQWLTVNLTLVIIAVIVDMAIIKKREKKRIEESDKKEKVEKEMSVFINIKSGGIGHNGICEMHQLFENNLFYFGRDVQTLYEMIGYEWDGAKYRKIIETKSHGKDTNDRRAGGFASASFGTAGGIGNVKSVSNRNESGETVEKEVEEQGSAIIRMKRVSDERIVSFVIECNSETDKMIRCFNNVPI